jgi:hypothetical protein
LRENRTRGSQTKLLKAATRIQKRYTIFSPSLIQKRSRISFDQTASTVRHRFEQGHPNAAATGFVLNSRAGTALLWKPRAIQPLTSFLYHKRHAHDPFITIDGQNAPGPGIMLRNYGIEVQTHGVVLRY